MLPSTDESQSAVGVCRLAVEERSVALPATDVLVTGSYPSAPDRGAVAVELRG